MTQAQQYPMRAAIDVGSNTIHIVVARCQTTDLDIVADEVEMVRIGESVTANGEISPQKREAAIAVLKTYKTLAEQHGAEPIFVVATEAIRQARNSADFLAHVKRETGLEVQLITGSAEAALTFYGATYELLKESHSPVQIGVMDLGGGSTELVVASNGHITWRTSFPVGSGWLHDRYMPSDPPTATEREVATTFLNAYFQGLRMKRRPPALVVTGGSANSLLLMMTYAFGLDRVQERLTRDDLLRCEGLLNALPAAENARRYQQPISRARILPAGALIIQVMMARLELNEIRVSPHGIREGVLLAYERYGEQWLDEVGKVEPRAEHEQEESFVHSGRRLLQERLEKLTEWREEVLKHEDIEAVHKMRVASRRLRAVLDAYQSCCNSKAFKKAYREIKETADILGAARDADVMLQGLQEDLERADGEEQQALHWLVARLDTYREQRQEALEDFFASDFDEKKLGRLLDACISKGAVSNGEG